MTYAQPNDRVLITKLDSQSNLPSKYLKTIGIVISVNLDAFPVYAVVEFFDGAFGTVYLMNLETVPPVDSIIQIDDEVRIIKTYSRTYHHHPNESLIGQIGKIVGYDTRDYTYLVDCEIGIGWFPLTSLLPLDFKGDVFYYPGDVVTYEKEKTVIQEVKKTKFGNGQLLKIKGEWVPSIEVIL